MKENRDKTEIRQRRGLYFALAVCLVAIAVAAVSAYGSIMDYVAEQNTQAQVSQNEIVVREDPETVVNTVPEIKTEESSQTETESVAPPQETAAEPEETPAEPEEEIEAEETNNEATYTPSEALKYPVASTEAISAFSNGELVYSNVMKDYRAHNGFDIKASVSEAVFSVGNGKVLRTYNDILLGNVIEVEHGEYIVRYCGLGDTLLVHEGDLVFLNTAIGSVFSVPMEKNAEAHLHIEVLKDDEYIDPTQILAK